MEQRILGEPFRSGSKLLETFLCGSHQNFWVWIPVRNSPQLLLPSFKRDLNLGSESDVHIGWENLVKTADFALW